MTAKKLYLRSFGCQMNDYDSARIVDLMAKNGYERVAAPEEADLVVIVTCSIREKAQEKTFSDLGRIREIKKKNPELLIAVGGCVASQEGENILKRSPWVDVVFGPQTLHRLPKMIEERLKPGARKWTSRFLKLKSLIVCLRPRATGPRPLFPSWKVAASTALTAWCLIRAAKKSAVL